MLLRKSTALYRNSLGPLLRSFSESKNLVGVDIQSGVASVILQRPPVNSLNLGLLTELTSTLTDLQKQKVRGIILKSSSDNVFSAGIDLGELYKPKLEDLKRYWGALQDAWIKLYGHPAVTVACINGHAPAGGCLLSLCCEYRVLVKDKTIGLNETQLGLVAPAWFIASMENVIGRRQTEKALTVGKMFTHEEALKVGLVDEIAQDTADAVAKSEAYIKSYKNISPLARAETKRLIRQSTIQALKDTKEEDIRDISGKIMSEQIQQGVEMYMKALKSRK